MYEGTIQEKFDVGEKRLLFLSLLFFNQNFFGVFGEKFRHGVQNCFSRQPLIIPRKNKALEWNRNFRLFWEFNRQIYGVWWQIHARLSELHSTCKNEQFKKNLMFWNKVYCFYHFWILIKICSDFLRKSTARWSKLHSTSTDGPAEKEEQISWITHNFLHFFEISSVNLTEFGVDVSCTVVKTAFYM